MKRTHTPRILEIIAEFTPEHIKKLNEDYPWVNMRLHCDPRDRESIPAWFNAQVGEIAESNNKLFRRAMDGVFKDIPYHETLFYYTLKFDRQFVSLIASGDEEIRTLLTMNIRP